MKTTRSRLFETAIRLFKEKGYENVSVSHICKESGIPRSTFYANYRSKEDLILHIYSDEFIRSNNLFQQFANEKNDFERIAAIYSHYIKLALNVGPEVSASFMIIELNSNIGIYDKMMDVRKLSISLCRNCQDMGIILNREKPEFLIKIASCALNNMVFEWSRLGGDYPLEEESRKALETIFNVAPLYRKYPVEH